MLPPFPPAWDQPLSGERSKPYFIALEQFVAGEQAVGQQILPALPRVFSALEATRPEEIKVVILGQDPYPTPGHAHGLCFSVQPGVRPIPGSLRNIYKELLADVGFTPPGHGCLEDWARRGVLLLNTVLTVRAGEAGSHQKKGWETFTDRVIGAVNAGEQPVVFVLWGRLAQMKRPLIDETRHAVVVAAHPSPLSARLFLGCRCFSAVNRLLVERGRLPVDWSLAPSSAEATEGTSSFLF